MFINTRIFTKLYGLVLSNLGSSLSQNLDINGINLKRLLVPSSVVGTLGGSLQTNKIECCGVNSTKSLYNSAEVYHHQ